MTLVHLYTTTSKLVFTQLFDLAKTSQTCIFCEYCFTDELAEFDQLGLFYAHAPPKAWSSEKNSYQNHPLHKTQPKVMTVHLIGLLAACFR